MGKAWALWHRVTYLKRRKIRKVKRMVKTMMGKQPWTRRR